MPPKFTCDGEDISPKLEISGVPKEARSLVLMLDDPDTPSGSFAHWLVWNIPPDADKIVAKLLPAGAVEGLNSTGTIGYKGPCPPSGTHSYIFTLYALDIKLENLNPEETDKKAIFEEMTGHIIGTTELVGLYSRTWVKNGDKNHQKMAN